MSCKPLSVARMSLLCFHVVCYRDNSGTSLWNFATWCLFMPCWFSLSRFIMHSQRNRINSFRARLKENIFAFVGKLLEHFENREILFVHRPKFLTVSAGPWYKILREWIRCLYNNVIDRLCVPAYQSTNDQREHVASRYHSTCSEPRPNCVLRVVTWITSRGDLKRTMWVFCNSTSLPSLLCWKKLCLM